MFAYSESEVTNRQQMLLVNEVLNVPATNSADQRCLCCGAEESDILGLEYVEGAGWICDDHL